MNFVQRPLLLALDLESVLVPEIWAAIAGHYGIPELRFTTRDESDYAALMRRRLDLCNRHGLRLTDLRKVVRSLEPLPGARSVLDRMRARLPVVILSDTFYELASPLLESLGFPALLCHNLIMDERGFIRDFRLRSANAKQEAVKAFQGLGYRVMAVGDSLNDAAMLAAAERALLLAPCAGMSGQLQECTVVSSILELPPIVDRELGEQQEV